MKNLSQREENILLLLKKLDFLNRDQLIKLFSLGSVRNANRILGGMKDYLSSYREGYQTIYYLNKEGRDYVDSQKVRKKGNYADHCIARNDFYIFAGRPADWKNEIEVSDGQTTVICDAMFKSKGQGHFLEVDLQQSMAENRKKIASYKTLYERGLSIEGKRPTLIWLTATELRRKQLTQACEGLPFKVFTQQDIQ
ncbi:replication-relaxation family protein [Terribacillus saccharophilus]|uniref:replication-relaxation family protein n=1 Tax=Terribacillus saccharophilus TaxID=361277 RepID=UPI003807EA28